MQRPYGEACLCDVLDGSEGFSGRTAGAEAWKVGRVQVMLR